MLVHHIRMLLESDPELGVLKTDISNAFNCISRQQLLNAVVAHFLEVHAHVQQMYGITSPLLYFNGKSVSVIPPEEGLHQGKILWVLSIRLSIHPDINRLQMKHSDLAIWLTLMKFLLSATVNSMSLF